MHPVLKAGFALGLVAGAAGAAAQSEPSFDYYKAHTVAGELEIDQVDSVVRLKGVALLHGDDDRKSFSIKAAYPPIGQARLILISYDTGDPTCAEMYLVLEVLADGSTRTSPDFGNCWVFVSPLEKDERLKMFGHNNLRYVDGAWKIGFPPEKKGARGLEWFTYKDGMVTPRYKGLGEKAEEALPAP